MDKSDYRKFLEEDEEFLENKYSALSDDDKYSLWVYVLTYNIRDRHHLSDPLRKFNKKNYEKWMLIEPKFETILDNVIEEYIQIWNPIYKGYRERTLEEEIYRRLKEG